MTKEIKVSETRLHKFNKVMNVVGKDEQRVIEKEVYVAEGRLILIDVSGGKVQIEAIQNKGDGTIFIVGRGWVKPVILSDIEKMEQDELMYHEDKGFKVGDIWNNFPDIIEAKSHWFPDMPKYKAFIHGFRKVLALPTMFSKNDLKDIVNGKLKAGDKVLVETEHVFQNKRMKEPVLALLPSQWDDTVKHWHRIKLDSKNQIKIHLKNPLKKTYDLIDLKLAFENGRLKAGNRTMYWYENFDEWFNANYNK